MKQLGSEQGEGEGPPHGLAGARPEGGDEPGAAGQLGVRSPASWHRITVVGLGLLGGSLAAAVRRCWPSVEIVAVDGPDVLASEAARALVDRGHPLGEVAAVEAEFARSDLVFLSATVGGIAAWLPRALRAAPLVTDCGSTKRHLVAAARACPRWQHFVPGHPMAGALGGLSGASADLFRDQPWVLCPQGVHGAALGAVREMTAAFGARSVEMAPQEHDRVVGITSHVPRLLASSLAGLASRQWAFGAAGPAFERLVRGAGGSTAMWLDIFDTNREEVASALKVVVADLQAAVGELESGGPLRQLEGLLVSAEQARRAYKSQAR